MVRQLVKCIFDRLFDETIEKLLINHCVQTIITDVKDGDIPTNPGNVGYTINIEKRLFDEVIETDILIIGIDDGQSCCENFGYDYSIDGTVYDGINAMKNLELLSKPRWMPESMDSQDASIMILTDYGELKLRVYNEHNGYYSHSIFARWKGYEYDGSL